MNPRTALRSKSGTRGQSMVEFALVALLLALLVAGIAEYGYLLNDYLNLLDASREAVRYASSFDPFEGASTGWEVNPQFYEDTIHLTQEVLAPLTLHAEDNDDIIVSFFTVGDGIYVRYPDETGYRWSSTQTSRFTASMIQSRLQSGAPPAGVLLVEIFYHYHHRLRMPVFTALVGDPIEVYSYSMMPLAAAKPADTTLP